VKLAEAQSFRRAAEQLNMSQPPLSVAIRQFEQELGTRLFDRGARGVTLTRMGASLLQPAREALARAERVRETARLMQDGEAGALSIGFVGSAMVEALPGIISRFHQGFPQVELSLLESTSAEICDAIVARDLEIGLVRLPIMTSANLEVHLIESDELVATIPLTHPLARQKSIALSELAGQPFILNTSTSVLHAVVFLACQKAGFKPRVSQQATQLLTVLGLVQSGLGVALLPSRLRRFLPENVVMVPLADPVPTEMGLICREDAGQTERNLIAMALP